MLANKSTLCLKVKTSVSGLTFTMPVTTVDSKKTCVGLYPAHKIDAKIKITFTTELLLSLSYLTCLNQKVRHKNNDKYCNNFSS